MKHLLLILIISGFFSCSKYTEQLAEKDLTKAYVNYPVKTAEKTRGWFPCITKQSDTVLVTKDSTVYIDCPDLPTIIHEPGSTDTIIVHNIVKVPVNLPVRTQVITKYIEDSAKIKTMQSTIDEKDKAAARDEVTIKVLQNNLDEMKSKRDKWRTRFFILAGIFAVAILLRIKRII